MIEKPVYLTAQRLLDIAEASIVRTQTVQRLVAEVFRLRAKLRYVRRGPTLEETKQLDLLLKSERETAKRLASLREKARAAVDSYRDPEESVNSNTTEALFRELEAELG